MIRLAGISGTKATITIALITLLDKDRFQFSPAAMSKLGLKEGSRIDVLANPDDDNALYVAVVPGKSEGRNVSKTGKVQSEQIHSWLVDNPAGENAQYEIGDTTVEFDDCVWHKLTIFEGSNDQEVASPTPVATTEEEEVSTEEVVAQRQVVGAEAEEEDEEEASDMETVSASTSEEEVEDTDDY